MEDNELMKCLILYWKGETLSFLLIVVITVQNKKEKFVVINVLKCIGAYVGLNTFINNFHIHWWVNDFFIMKDEELFIHLMD